MPLSDWIKQQGQALGFARVGIAPTVDLPELSLFSKWVERGYAGQLGYMHNPKRADVRSLLPDARSVICCALAYDTDHPRSTEVPPDRERGWLSRYAWGEDYHHVLTEKLHALQETLVEKVGPGFESKLCVDTGPVLERVYAKYAGLGWQAKNTCLLDEELGSFFFIGVLVTNLELTVDTPPPDGCGSCTLCLEACPTGAIVEPYVLDTRRCLSYLTIELRDAIPEEFRRPMGRHVFGCDICQDVCPYNRRAAWTQLTAFQPRGVEYRKTKIEKREGTGTGDESSCPARPESSRRERSRGDAFVVGSSPAGTRARGAATTPPSPGAGAAGLGDNTGHRSPITDHPSLFHPRPVLSPAAPLSRAESRDAAGTPSANTAHPSLNTNFPSLFHPRLDWLASLSEEEFRRVFRGSAVKRAKRRGLLRNTLVAMGNSGNRKFRPMLEEFATSDDPLLAEHARWALARLGQS